MTAAKSSRKSFFWNRFFNNVKSDKKNLIVNIILHVLGLPVLSVIGLIVTYYEDYGGVMDDATEGGCITFAVISVCTLMASLFVGSTIALSNFKYLYKKNLTDMNYALPLSGTQRFFADYLSGLAIYIVPPIVSVITSCTILGVGHVFMSKGEMWEVVPFMISLASIAITTMILYYAISVFALTFCGNSFEAHFSIIAFVIMIPATIGCLWFALINTSAFGIADEEIFTSVIFTSSNPIGVIGFVYDYIDTYGSSHSSPSAEFSVLASMFIKWTFSTLVFIAAYVAAAWFLHTKRKAEDVSKPYVYRSFFYVLMTMGVFCVLSLFIMNDGFILAGVVICAVVWFIMEIITRRGFKKFWTAVVAFGCAVVSVFVICGLCEVTDGFGMSRYLPASLNVTSVTIECPYVISSNAITYTDRDVIKNALDLNKEIIDRHFNPEKYSYKPVDDNAAISTDDYLIEFTYSTIMGKKTKREYYINSGMAAELAMSALLSDEYAEGVAKDIGRQIYSTNSDITPKYRLSVMDKFRMNDTGRDKYTKMEVEEIRRAYVEDMKNMTEDDVRNGKVCAFIDGCFVLESFEKTREILKIEPTEITLKNMPPSVKVTVNPVFRTYIKDYIERNEKYYYYTHKEVPTEAETITRASTKEQRYYYYDYNISDDSKVSYFRNSETIELLNMCTPLIIGEKPLAFVTVNNNIFYIRDTEENRKYIENLDPSKYYSGTDEYGWDYS